MVMTKREYSIILPYGLHVQNGWIRQKLFVVVPLSGAICPNC
jgi:hypothetical protein